MSRGRRTSGALFINILGGFRAAAPRPDNLLLLERKKTRALLAVLALDPGRIVPRGRLTALLWSSQSEDTGRHGLRQCLFDLRQALTKADVDVIRTEGDGIGVARSRIVVDVERFDQLAGEDNATALKEAIDVYHGDLLEGFSLNEPPFEEWLQAERERLRSRAAEVLRKLLAEHVREKVIDAAVQVAVRLLAFEPFDESVHRTLMRLYAESGRRSTALRQYEVCVEVLSRELGVEPEPETQNLYRRLVAERSTKTPAITRPQPRPISRGGRGHGAYRAPGATPLIGREADVAWLKALWQRSHRAGPQLGLILGEAGIGKSRLIGELASRAQRRSDEFLLGRGREGEDVLPFAPWIEALRPVLSEQLLGQVGQVTRLDLARLFPEIADGLGPPPTGIEEGPRIFEAIAHVLRLLAAAQPLVAVIEDLHWCDDMTVRLLKFLPRRLEGQPVLLAGTARPEEIVRGVGPAAVLDALRRDPACVSTTLAPLSRQHAIELFQMLLASRDAASSVALAERVWRLSEGNPFVVIECARAVRDRGAATSEALIELPDQVRALTERYLADLGGCAGRLADAAAVCGRDFEVPVVCHAAGLTQSEGADALEELVRRRVIREVSGRFDFRHDRIREAAYARLLGPRRSLLHGKIAEALEAVHVTELDPHCAAIGTHHLHAGNWSAACDYLTRAGYQAWHRGAGREALACFEDALHALAHLPLTMERREQRVRLHLLANGASVARLTYERGLPHLHEAEKLAAPLVDRRWEGRVAAALSSAYRPVGDFDRSRRFGQRALEVAQETGDRWLEAVARLVLGLVEFNAGNLRQSVEHLTAVLSYETDDPDVGEPYFPHVERLATMRSIAIMFMVNSLTQLGEFDTALCRIEDAFRESDTLGDPLGTLRLSAFLDLGRVECGRGDFGAAVRAYESALAVYREDCHRHLYRPLATGLAVCYALQGRVREGVELFEQYETDERTIGSRTFKPTRLVHHSRILLEAGRIENAARLAEEALCVAREERNQPFEAAAHALLADVERLRHPVIEEEMERHLLAAIRLAERLEMGPLAARCHQLLAWLYEKIGDRSRNEHHSAAAAGLLQQMGRDIRVDAAAVF